ncbi:kinase [Myxococcota bacterium]|nr:kinase [Myxococcota bacterium]
MRAAAGRFDPGTPRDFRELAVLLARDWQREKGLRRIGIAGGQGTGKSTLGRALLQACSAIGLRTCVLALDDYYLSRTERAALARRVHPLFETRGPPGTHDVARLEHDLVALATDGACEVDVPIFDKGLDDRVGTRRLSGPFDLVLLEGWCVGATAAPEAALYRPCNAIERDADPDGRWRRHANDRLAREYAALFAHLDRLVFLKAPDLDAVRRWRLEQEAERPLEQRLDAAAIERFVAHYERITRDMLAGLPGRADWTILLGTDHSIAAIERRR